MKRLVIITLLFPAWAMADSPFAGTWIMQPELTTFGEDHPMTIMIERGGYRRTDCVPGIELAADGSDIAVKDQPLFDHMSVRVVNRRRVDISQEMGGKLAWKGSYTVSKDQRSMFLDFDDERTATPVTGTLEYARVGEPLSAAHALSGSWQPQKLTRISSSASTLTIDDTRQDSSQSSTQDAGQDTHPGSVSGLALTWSDGRHVQSPLDAKYYPLSGYLPGAIESVMRPRPDTLAINREQGIVPVEVSRVIASPDGQHLTVKHVDWLCRSLTSYVYLRKTAS